MALRVGLCVLSASVSASRALVRVCVCARRYPPTCASLSVPDDLRLQLERGRQQQEELHQQQQKLRDEVASFSPARLA